MRRETSTTVPLDKPSGFARLAVICGPRARRMFDRGTERNLLLRPTMPVPFPHHHQTWLVRTLSSRARLEAPPRPLISGGPPAELDGDATAWSAEQLLLNAVGLSLLTTFEAFAARDRVDLLAWEARTGGTVERGPRGPELTKVSIEIDMEVNDVDRARLTLEDAQRHCLLIKALHAPVNVLAKIRPVVRKAG